MRIDMRMPEAIVVCVRGFVHRLDPLTGRNIWTTRLPKSSMGTFGTILIDGDIVLAGVAGRTYCLDLEDGRLIWQNDLPSMGLGLVSIATPSSSADGSGTATQQAVAAQALSSAQGTS